jgi:hypothetical protein
MFLLSIEAWDANGNPVPVAALAEIQRQIYQQEPMLQNLFCP